MSKFAGWFLLALGVAAFVVWPVTTSTEAFVGGAVSGALIAAGYAVLETRG